MDALRAAARNLGNVTDAQGLAERVVAGALTSVPGAERAALHTAAARRRDAGAGGERPRRRGARGVRDGRR